MTHTPLKQAAIINEICDIIANIAPFDTMEQEHIDDTLAWIKSGAPIFRIQKPDVPNKHLVTSAIIFDEKASKILLVDHKNYLEWLPAGGHVDPNEHPKTATVRECMEELNLKADFWCEDPIFFNINI